MTTIVRLKRKSAVLTKSTFGCLKNEYALNVTKGCEFNCVYCYARGYPEAPPIGEVCLYENLPEKLAAELDNPRRRKKISRVLFNTASDSFQSHPDILDVTYGAMAALLKRQVGISFLTKGWIPDRFVALFEKKTDLVSARIGLVSTDETYRGRFEPGAATATERLDNIERFKTIGVSVDARIDPIIPFYTDDEASIRDLYENLAKRGITSVSLSYLHLRPAIADQLRRELPRTEFRLLEGCFMAQDWKTVGTSTRSKLIPLPVRKKGYARFEMLAKQYGIRPIICRCKNPDMNANICSAVFREKAADVKSAPVQLRLFD